MDRVIEQIKKRVIPATVPPGGVLRGKIGDQYQCYFLDSGLAVVYSDNNPRPLGAVRGSHLFGLSQLLCPKGEFKLKIIHSSIIYTIPATSLIAIIDETNQWSGLASHLSELVYFISNRTEKDKKNHTASLILQTLHMLQKESEEVRLAHTVNDYVREITGLSHSTVTRGLDALKKQGYIEIHNGILLRFHQR
ncbi:putative DNA-binding transcriptional regulator [Yersinia aldovae]|uniref:helix-turn-helix domain-containing protein n=1 Tax=Yersinia aldovae TaxID=29483 RepID=UPI0005E25862|nr:helix-turn-helix domain-containing protein [Yersinia aldovae]CNI11519.1 putative DNA-binding transcriptional regulator [Yersinia aldovae]